MGWGGFLVITVSHPTFCCVGVGLWLRWGWAVTTDFSHIELNDDVFAFMEFQMQISYEC